MSMHVAYANSQTLVTSAVLDRRVVSGHTCAVLLSPDDLEGLEETIAVLADSEAIRLLTASEAELARGEGESEQDLAAAMRRRKTA